MPATHDAFHVVDAMSGRRLHERQVEAAHVRVALCEGMEHAVERHDLRLAATRGGDGFVAEMVEALGKLGRDLALVRRRRDRIGGAELAAEFDQQRVAGVDLRLSVFDEFLTREIIPPARAPTAARFRVTSFAARRSTATPTAAASVRSHRR